VPRVIRGLADRLIYHVLNRERGKKMRKSSLSPFPFQNAIETEFEGIKTKVMSPEYLIALLLKAGRDKDKIKIEMLLRQTTIDKEKLKEILSKYNLSEKFKEYE
jgi:hypothetical protein